MGICKVIISAALRISSVEHHLVFGNDIPWTFASRSFARIEGTLAKQRSRMEQFQIASQAGTSLLTMTTG